MEWFVYIDKKKHGPYDLLTMQEMVKNHQIVRGTLVYKVGMDTWVSAVSMGELFSNGGEKASVNAGKNDEKKSKKQGKEKKPKKNGKVFLIFLMRY